MTNKCRAIFRLGYVSASRGEKWLDSDDLTMLQPTGITVVVVADDPLRLFMQTPANPVPGKDPGSP
jgi:hypothetical protein